MELDLEIVLCVQLALVCVLGLFCCCKNSVSTDEKNMQQQQRDVKLAKRPLPDVQQPGSYEVLSIPSAGVKPESKQHAGGNSADYQKLVLKGRPPAKATKRKAAPKPQNSSAGAATKDSAGAAKKMSTTPTQSAGEIKVIRKSDSSPVARQSDPDKNPINFYPPLMEKNKHKSSEGGKSDIIKAREAHQAKQPENIASNYYAPMMEKHKNSGKSEIEKAREQYLKQQPDNNPSNYYKPAQMTEKEKIAKAIEAYQAKKADNQPASNRNTPPLTDKEKIARAREAYQQKQAENNPANYYPGFGPNKAAHVK